MAVQAQLYSDHQNMGLGLPICGSSQDWVLSSVLGIDEPPKQMQIMTSAALQKSQQINLPSSSIAAQSSHMTSSNSLASELENQRLEMDWFLHFQKEKLMAILHEETRRSEVILLQKYESNMKILMNQKDEVLTNATNRRRELQSCLLRAEREAKEWEKKALENEAMVLELNKLLIQTSERECQLYTSGAEDAESACDVRETDEGGASRRMGCKVCHVRSSCVLFLPCRHLCCCRTCEGLIRFCPVCESVKNGSVEVFLV